MVEILFSTLIVRVLDFFLEVGKIINRNNYLALNLFGASNYQLLILNY